MRILFINTLYDPFVGGGAEITLQSIVEGVARRGIEVAVLTTASGNGVVLDHVNGIKVYRVGIENIYWHYAKENKGLIDRFFWHALDIKNKKMAKHVEGVLNDFKPDIVNCHNLAGFSSLTWDVISKKNITLVQVLHDTYNICPNSNMLCGDIPCETQCRKCSIFRYPHKTLSENVDCVVGVSEFVLDKHLKHGLFKNARIKTVINNARNIKHGFSQEKSPGNVVFGFIGTLVRSKGVEVLIDAFNNLKMENARLKIAGKGELNYVNKLQSISTTSVDFVGYVKPEDFFPSIDYLVVPSLWNDTFPGVVFEALAYGVPVVGSIRGGIPEMIEDGKNGFLFEPNKNGDLQKILARLVKFPEQHSAMSSLAIESSVRFTDTEAWISKYMALFDELNSKKGVRYDQV